jgi:hypothetical protein
MRQAGDYGLRMLPAAEESDLQPPIQLSPGDLIAARVVRGSAGLAPWRLQTLGRDRDLVVWPFETEDAAEAAHAELEQALHTLENPTPDDEMPSPRGRPRR